MLGLCYTLSLSLSLSLSLCIILIMIDSSMCLFLFSFSLFQLEHVANYNVQVVHVYLPVALATPLKVWSIF